MLRKRRGGQTKKYKKARRGGRKENKAEAGCRRGYYMKARVAGAKIRRKREAKGAAKALWEIK